MFCSKEFIFEIFGADGQTEWRVYHLQYDIFKIIKISLCSETNYFQHHVLLLITSYLVAMVLRLQL